MWRPKCDALIPVLCRIHLLFRPDLAPVSSILVRFRSHSLLPRDMAARAFVSSTGDVEEKRGDWSTLGCPVCMVAVRVLSQVAHLYQPVYY